MGIQKGLGLVDTLSKSKTFMKLARTASKGSCTMKEGQIAGKQAVNFFERLPIVSDLTRNIPTEKLVIRFGTKGTKGSSVSGFHIFNGDSLVAKGAMGIDKTRGKQPILQMRLQVGENGKAARLNLNYNGNNVFNGNTSSTSFSKDGKFSLSQNYGDSLHIEYAESPLHYDLLTNSSGKSFRNVGEFPTAHQFEQYRPKLNEQVERFVSGKQSPAQKAKLKYEKSFRLKEKQWQKEKLQKQLDELKSKYEPKIAGLSSKVAEQDALAVQIKQAQNAKNLAKTEAALALRNGNIQEAEYNTIRDQVVRLYNENPTYLQRDIAAIRSQKDGISYADSVKCAVADILYKNAEIEALSAKQISKVELKAAKQEVKLLKKQLKQETKEIQRSFSTHRPAESRIEPINFSDVKFFTNKKSIQSILRNEKISLRKIPEYPNKEVIEQLKNIKGTPTEKIEQIKNIFCKEMGIDVSLVNVRAAKGFELGANSLAFMPHSGEILYNETLISKLKDAQLCGAIRHELDHLEVFGKLAKTLGLNKMKQICAGHVKSAEQRAFVKENFNASFYERIGKQLNTNGFDSKLYEQAANEYEGLNNLSKTLVGRTKNLRDYYSSPLESKAYGVQMSLTKSLGSPDVQTILNIHITKQMAAEIERIQQLAPNGFDMEKYLTNIMKSVKTRMGDRIESNEFYYNILQELRKV